jgi:sugar (pentulose or hexulose) kinase
LLALAALGLAAPTTGAQAQSIVMAGNHQNFDVLNNTGAPTYGFEMEVYGVSTSQLTRIFPSNFNVGVIRYGFVTATDFSGGVRWAATYDPAGGSCSTAAPVPASLSTVRGDSCWTLGMPSGLKQ